MRFTTLLVLGLAVAGHAQATLYDLVGNAEGDHFGWSIREAGDLNRDGYTDFIIGAPFADDAGVDAGRAYIYSGVDGTLLFTLDGQNPQDCFGFAVSAAGDVNRDGFPDVIVGAPGPGYRTTVPGSARVFSGEDGSVIYTMTGDNIGDRFGYSVSAVGDVNRDTFLDVIIGAPGDDEAPHIAGYAYIYSGRNGTKIRSVAGTESQERFGFTVGVAGDVDGDSSSDFTVGAPRSDQSFPDAGKAVVYSGWDTSVLFTFTGVEARSQFGSAVRTAGDVNGDGFTDYVIGARFERDRGRVHVLSGRPGATDPTIRVHTGPTRSMWFGQSVSGGGDIDNDCFADILVGAPIDGVTPGQPQQLPITGSLQVFSGRNGNKILDLKGDEDMAWTGWSVSGFGDINRDGAADFAVGAPLYQDGKGRVQVLSVTERPLTADTYTMNLTTGGIQTFNLNAGPARAGQQYLLVGTASGTCPGLSLAGGIHLPLNPDGWMISTASSPNQFPMINTLGTLDANGRGAAAFQLPGVILTPLAQLGFVFHHAFIVTSGSTFLFASNAVPITFTL